MRCGIRASAANRNLVIRCLRGIFCRGREGSTLVAPDSGPFPAVHPIEALAMPMAHGRTGLLTMRSGPRWHDICFVDGRANRVESSAAEESLPMLLAARGSLPKEVADEVISRVREGRGNPVETLVERGAISNDKMEGLLRWRALELLKMSSSWTEGSYTFRQILNPSLPGPPLALALPQILARSCFKNTDSEDIRTRLNSWMMTRPLLNSDPETLLAEYGLKPNDGTLLVAFDGSMTLRQILSDPPVEANRAAKLSWLLLVSGALDAGEKKRISGTATPSTSMDGLLSGSQSDDDGDAAATISMDQVPAAIPQDAVPHDETVGEAEDRVTALGRSLFGDEFALDASARDALATPLSAPTPEGEDGQQEDLDDFGDVDESALDVEQRALLNDLRSYLADIESRNYLDVLNLQPECSSTDVRQAFFALAKQYHPDHFAGQPGAIRKRAHEIFARISESQEALESDTARKAYVDKVIYGRKDAQELAMEQACRLMDAEQAYKIGVRLLHAGQITDAHKKFEAACGGDPEEAEYRCYHGYTTFLLAFGHDAEQSQQGVDQMTEAANSTKNPTHYHLLAKAAIKQGNDDFALELLKRVLRRQRSNEEALNEYRACEQRVAKALRKQSGRLSGLFARFKKE